MSEAKETFARNRYALLKKLVPEAVCSFLYEYALKYAQSGRLAFGDSGVPGTPNCYADAFMESLLEILLPVIETESGLKLYPTYSYFRVYNRGDILKPHQDRPSCEVSLTLNLGYVADEPWPIWVEADGSPKSFSLEAGDALLYRGIELPHWRESFTGDHAAQVFLHYVAQEGPHREWRFDKREALGASPLATKLLRQLNSTSGPAESR